MERESFVIPNMSCEHCLRTIREALERLGGVENVNVDMPRKTVSVDHAEGTNRKLIVDTLERAGYTVRTH